MIKLEVIAEKSLYKRKGPGTNYAIAGVLYHGDAVEAVNTCGDWYKLKDGCYCSKKYCKELPNNNKKNTTTNNKPTTNTSTTKSNTTNKTTSTNGTVVQGSAIAEKINAITQNKYKMLESGIDSSTRIFGLPHQLLSSVDYRISDVTKLGRLFTETFIMNAPMIYLKPGKASFLPDMSKEERTSFMETLVQSAAGNMDAQEVAKQISNAVNGDNMKYFEFTQTYSKYIATVNMLCRICAVFFNLHNKKVPWVAKGDVTYGSYDWSTYNMSSIYDDLTQKQKKKDKSDKGINTTGAFNDDTTDGISEIVTNLLSDGAYVPFYVDANASFNESIGNSTTTSMVASFTDQLENIGKELSFVSGVTGLNIDDVVNSSVSSVDSLVQDLANGSGAIGTFLKRLTGSASQILTGSNFIVPDVWSDSDYSKSYSFTITLSTPYGTPEARFLNIIVPLMHILALALPVQSSANTFTAPPIIRAFSPGWFSCDMGIIDQVSIDKGGSGDAWGADGLPNEIKVSISVKDLFSILALPENYSVNSFFNNSSLIDYLMVNCGIDISKPSLDLKLSILLNLLMGSIQDILPNTVMTVTETFKEAAAKIFNLYR